MADRKEISEQSSSKIVGYIIAGNGGHPLNGFLTLLSNGREPIRMLNSDKHQYPLPRT